MYASIVFERSGESGGCPSGARSISGCRRASGLHFVLPRCNAAAVQRRRVLSHSLLARSLVRSDFEAVPAAPVLRLASGSCTFDTHPVLPAGQLCLPPKASRPGSKVRADSPITRQTKRELRRSASRPRLVLGPISALYRHCIDAIPLPHVLSRQLNLERGTEFTRNGGTEPETTGRR